MAERRGATPKAAGSTPASRLLAHYRDLDRHLNEPLIWLLLVAVFATWNAALIFGALRALGLL